MDKVKTLKVVVQRDCYLEKKRMKKGSVVEIPETFYNEDWMEKCDGKKASEAAPKAKESKKAVVEDDVI